MRWIILPWCENEHWKMIILELEFQFFSIIDSLGVKSRCVSKVKKFLNQFIRHPWMKSWTHKEIQTERQTDGHNCGIHILRYFDMISGHEYLNGTPNESREQILDFFIRKGKVSAEKCSSCARIQAPQSKKYNIENEWVQCANCTRKFHWICLNSETPSLFVPKC